MTRADVVVRGRIASLRGSAGFGWVSAIAVSEGRVVAVGSASDVEPFVGPGTRRLVVGPEFVVVPGITDAHLHFADAALAAQRIDLEAAPTLADGLAMVAAHVAAVANRDAWIEGGGWDAARWGRWPTAWDLAVVARGRRVALWSHDHHALWVSERVVVESGLDAYAVDPPGGAHRRDSEGRLTGVLQETAVQAVVDRLPRPGSEELEPAIRSFTHSLLSLGVVGAHDPGDLRADAALNGGFGLAVALADRGELPLRLHCSVREPALTTAISRGLRTGAPLSGDGRIRMGWLKLFADGALGSRTALLLEPYEGTDDDRGIAVTPAEELAALARRAAEADIVPQIHAIGDAALRATIAAVAPVAASTGPRVRIEHVQFADPGDLAVMASNGIAASVQPIHLRSDAAKAKAALGSRAERRGFLLRSLIGAGVTTAFGTDAPVEPPDPWPGIAIAVTRSAPEWREAPTFGPAEAITLAESLRAATVGPALIAGQSDVGHLDVGAHADFVAIPAAALTEPAERAGALWNTRPAFTAIAGKIVFEA